MKLHLRVSNFKISASKLAALDAAWAEFQKFGAHEGSCDMGELCPKCGQSKHGCELHVKTTEQRMAIMAKAILALREK